MSQCSAAITWGEEEEEEAHRKPPCQEWAVKANVSDGDVLFVSLPSAHLIVSAAQIRISRLFRTFNWLLSPLPPFPTPASRLAHTNPSRTKQTNNKVLTHEMAHGSPRTLRAAVVVVCSRCVVRASVCVCRCTAAISRAAL